jgi:hypothetical protein
MTCLSSLPCHKMNENSAATYRTRDGAQVLREGGRGTGRDVGVGPDVRGEIGGNCAVIRGV